MKKVLRILSVVTLLNCAFAVSGDTLIDKANGKIEGLGSAKIENGTIHWTPCFSEQVKDYKAADYAVVKGGNCELPNLRPVLPQTVSGLPLIGLLGFGCLGVFLILGMLRRPSPGRDAEK